MLLAFGLPALRCTVSFAVAIHTCHIGTAARRHDSGGAIGELWLATTARSTLKPSAGATPCGCKALGEKK